MGRRQTKTAIITFIITLLVTSAIFVFVGMKMLGKKTEQIESLSVQVADSQVLAFATDLKANHTITFDDLDFVDIKTASMSSDMYIVPKGANGDSEKQDLVGRILRVNVSEKLPAAECLFYPEGDSKPDKDVRLLELSDSYLSIPTDLYVGDYFDVRITFPEGQDFIVLVGKRVESLGASDSDGNYDTSSVFVYANEEEIMLLGSAIIERYMQDGIRLYATKYVDPSNQLFAERDVDYVAMYDEGLAKAKLEKEYQLIADSPTAKSGDFYLTLEEYMGYTEAQKAPFKSFVPGLKVADGDVSIESIARLGNLNVDIAKAIKEAKESNNEERLAYYSNVTLIEKTPVEKTYPVRGEILSIVRANPNIVDEIKQEFEQRSEATLDNASTDLLQRLREQYDLAIASYDLEKAKDLMDQISELENGSRVGAKLETELDAQRKRRQNYIRALIGGELD